MEDNADTKRILAASPPEDWRRPLEKFDFACGHIRAFIMRLCTALRKDLIVTVP